MKRRDALLRICELCSAPTNRPLTTWNSLTLASQRARLLESARQTAPHRSNDRGRAGTNRRFPTMANVAQQYTSETLPNGLTTLRTGTANDGRPLIKIGRGAQAELALADIRGRLPSGWTATVYAPSGIDAVLTHVARETVSTCT